VSFYALETITTALRNQAARSREADQERGKKDGKTSTTFGAEEAMGSVLMRNSRGGKGVRQIHSLALQIIGAKDHT
jgi:hypothetical protein